MPFITAMLAIVTGLIILLIIEFREEGKTFKPDWGRYAFALVIGVLAAFFIDKDATKFAGVCALILFAERIFRLFSNISK